MMAGGEACTRACAFKTLVFLDLETTDLPHTNPAITEISMIACSTENLENTFPVTVLPRVLNKLTLCVNPRKRISPEVVVLTGLDNLILSNEAPLDAKTLTLVSAFVDVLARPLCLIAHNGYNFDFPILARSFRQHGMSLAVPCIDSLNIFKIIDDETDKLTAFLDSELEEIARETAQPVVTVMDNISARPINRSTSPDLFMDDQIDDETLTQITEKAERMYYEELHVTPENKRLRVETPPRVPRKPPGRGVDKNRVKPRQLFQKRSYKLSEIYRRLFGEEAVNSHRAEDDAVILLKCVQSEPLFLASLAGNSRDLVSFAK